MHASIRLGVDPLLGVCSLGQTDLVRIMSYPVDLVSTYVTLKVMNSECGSEATRVISIQLYCGNSGIGLRIKGGSTGYPLPQCVTECDQYCHCDQWEFSSKENDCSGHAAKQNQL